MNKFPALFGRRSGEVVIARNQLVFTADDDAKVTFSLSLNHLEISLGGENSTYFYLKNKANPDKTICVQNKALIVELKAQNVAAAQVALESIKRKNFLRGLSMSSPLVITLALLILVPLALSFIPISMFNGLLSIKQEKKVLSLLWPIISKELEVVKKPEAERDLEKLITLLKANNPELSTIEFEPHMSSSRQVNAFATLGGIVVVNRGFIEMAHDTDEVMGVLAHELAHVQLRHSLKALAGGVGSLAGFIILASTIGYDAAGFLLKTSGLLTSKYSRENESAADAQGFKYLLNANVATRGMIDFFKKLDEKTTDLDKLTALISSHPLSKKRVEALQAMALENPQGATLHIPVTIENLRHSFSPN